MSDLIGAYLLTREQFFPDKEKEKLEDLRQYMRKHRRISENIADIPPAPGAKIEGQSFDEILNIMKSSSEPADRKNRDLEIEMVDRIAANAAVSRKRNIAGLVLIIFGFALQFVAFILFDLSNS